MAEEGALQSPHGVNGAGKAHVKSELYTVLEPAFPEQRIVPVAWYDILHSRRNVM